MFLQSGLGFELLPWPNMQIKKQGERILSRSGSRKPIAKCRPHDAVLSLGAELHLLRNISGRNHSHQDLTLTGLLEPNAPGTSLAAGPYLVAGKVEGHYRALDQDFPIATRCTMATTGVVCGAIETEVSYYKVLSLRSIREAAPGLQVKSLFRESTVLNRLIQSEANATLDEAQLPPGS